LASFALHVTSTVIDVNGKFIVGGPPAKENAQNAHSKEMRDTVGFESKDRERVK